MCERRVPERDVGAAREERAEEDRLEALDGRLTLGDERLTPGAGRALLADGRLTRGAGGLLLLLALTAILALRQKYTQSSIFVWC